MSGLAKGALRLTSKMDPFRKYTAAFQNNLLGTHVASDLMGYKANPSTDPWAGKGSPQATETKKRLKSMVAPTTALNSTERLGG
jgi:hypothetical protein